MTWTDWEPIPELRFVRPSGTTTKLDRLQQRYVRLLVDDNEHHVLERAYEWRDVETVLLDEQSTPSPKCPECGKPARQIWMQEHEKGCPIGTARPLPIGD